MIRYIKKEKTGTVYPPLTEDIHAYLQIIRTHATLTGQLLKCVRNLDSPPFCIQGEGSGDKYRLASSKYLSLSHKVFKSPHHY